MEGFPKIGVPFLGASDLEGQITDTPSLENEHCGFRRSGALGFARP